MTDQEKINEKVFEILSEMIELLDSRGYSTWYVKGLLDSLRAELNRRE